MTYTKEQFEELFSLLNFDQRKLLAQTTKDPEILDELSQDKNFYVRFNVALNSNTKPETLDVLYRDKDPYVRLKVTENPNYKKKITVELSSAAQHEALKKLIESSQDPELRNVTLE